MNKSVIIVTGGTIETSFALEFLQRQSCDYLIGVDRGLVFLFENQIEPTHIVGDFDSVDADVISYYKTQTSIPVREFNPVKDASDTEIALRLALELEAKTIWLLGATGTRLDHVMANIQILKIAQDKGAKAYIVDPCNRISLVESGVRLSKKAAYGKYFSVFPLGGKVQKLTIQGAKYPLLNHTLNAFDSLCVSNQLKDEDVVITFSEGTLVLMETRDR